MEDQERVTFSLDDSDDEIIEEEVIDRDEEYDDEDGDEEYDDYDDEEYDDEEDYGDDDYDDGYNDDYYDDRLNKVLDEIAEIKRGMQTPSTAVQQPANAYPQPMPPQYVYQPSAPPAGSEVVMYNEISRLRDELARNQSSLEMQKELTRIKEDMSRDQRFTEAQYNAEIKRLQDKIDDLLKNASSPQSEQLPAPQQEAGRIEGDNSSSVGIDKLLSVNEAILRTTCDSGSRLENEIAQLRKKVDEIPSTEELNRVVSSVKKAAHGVSGANPDMLNKLSEDIASLNAAVQNISGSAPVVQASNCGTPILVKGNNGDINASELLRQLYDIKSVIGSSSAAAVKRTQTLVDLVNDYKKVSYDVISPTVSLKDKLSSTFGFAKKLVDCGETDVVDLIQSTNTLINELATTPLNRSNFGELVSFSSENGDKAIPSSIRETADKFFNVADKVASASIDSILDYLPDLIAEKNILQNNAKVDENNDLLNDISDAMSAEEIDESAIKDIINRLTAVCVGDVITLDTIELPKSYKPSKITTDDSIFSKLAEIKSTVLDLADSMTSKAVEQPVDNDQEQAEQEETSEGEDGSAYTALFDAISELETRLTETVGANNISDALEELRSNYLDISERLVDLAERVANANAVPVDATVSELSDEERTKLIGDLDYIRVKLDEYDSFITQIADVRTDIINIPVPDYSEQFASVISEVTAQCDKLYDDISNTLLETESNILAHIPDVADIPNCVNESKDEIVAEIKAVRDTLTQVNETLVSTPVNEAVDQLRGDILNLADQIAVSSDADLVDRQRLLDDVAFLREQAEFAIAEKDRATQNPDEQIDEEVEDESVKLFEYLDDITARIERISALADDVITARDNTTATLEAIAPLADTLGVVSQDVIATLEAANSARDSANAVVDTITPINDTLNVVSQDVIATLEAANSARDSANAVVDTITPINDTLNVVSQDVVATLEAANSARDSVNSIIDTITPVSELVNNVSQDVLTLQDTSTTTLDTTTAVFEALTPMAEQLTNVATDVTATLDATNATRDAVSATFDALTPITEQLNAILDRLDTAAEEVQLSEEEVDQEAAPDYVAEDLEEIKENLNTILDTIPLFPQSDDLVTARDNTFSILDTLTLMPQSEDVTATRDNVAALLDAVTMLSDNVGKLIDDNADGAILSDISAIRASIPETLAEDIAIVRDNTTATLDAISTLAQTQDDVQYIRQKLDETPSEDDNAVSDALAGIMQDLGTVLDKLEAYEQTTANNRQEIIDAVGGIRDEIHITELDQSMEATGIDDEMRDALVTEIAEIRERLGDIENTTKSTDEQTTASFDNIFTQLLNIQSVLEAETLEIKNKLESGVATIDGDNTATNNAVDGLQAIIDELAVIREKLDAEPEYDTIEEILSLREDIKASRIVDQDDVSSELESIKNELAAISSGNILDEIRSLRDTVSMIGTGDIASSPTEGEVNLVLNEIVSLRDEVFAFKDEVLAATAAVQVDVPVEEPVAEKPEELNAILDELTDIRVAQGELSGSVEELKDVISRRTTLAADNTETVSTSGELNVVLDEIINLKNDIDSLNERVSADNGVEALAEQVDAIREAIDSLLDSNENVQEQNENSVSLEEIRDRLDSISENNTGDIALLAEKIDGIENSVNELMLGRMTDTISTEGEGNVNSGVVAILDDLRADIDEVKLAVSGLVPSGDVEGEVASLRNELEQLRAENEALRQAQNDAITQELAELKEAVHNMTLSAQPIANDNGETSYAVLIDEIKSLKDQIVTTAQPATATLDEETIIAIRDALSANTQNVSLASELGEIRDEIAQLRSLTAVTTETAGSEEIAAIRNELMDLKSSLNNADSMYGLAEDVTVIRENVRTLKDEPDLGVINEILALRDEFQELREQIEDVKRIAGETDKQSDEAILGEVQSLRDQLFAISMANVNDSTSGETNYESYNNLILDELASLRDQVESAGSSEELHIVQDELSKLKSSIDSREELYDALATRVAKLDNDATNNKILDELSSLRTELANQRDADLTTLNFMSEMAHLLERQNSYISQSTGSKITDEIESLKAEIASSNAVAEEVAKLRDLMSQSGNASDNEAILGALAELREELSSEEPSSENELILQEIARLRNEITALADNDRRSSVVSNDDGDELADSLSALKNQLNQIAGIIEPEKKEQKKSNTARKKSTAKKSTGKNSAKKNSNGSKRATPAQKPVQRSQVDVTDNDTVVETPIMPTSDEDDFNAKINEQIADFGGSDMSLNPNATENTMSTSDTLDVADRLAQKVANKLVIEQLVEQLGDDGLTDDKIDEILTELPKELTTTALDDQSERVRKLANRLVLNKLRTRLTGGEDEDDSDNQ